MTQVSAERQRLVKRSQVRGKKGIKHVQTTVCAAKH